MEYSEMDKKYITQGMISLTLDYTEIGANFAKNNALITARVFANKARETLTDIEQYKAKGFLFKEDLESKTKKALGSLELALKQMEVKL